MKKLAYAFAALATIAVVTPTIASAEEFIETSDKFYICTPKNCLIQSIPTPLEIKFLSVSFWEHAAARLLPRQESNLRGLTNKSS